MFTKQVIVRTKENSEKFKEVRTELIKSRQALVKAQAGKKGLRVV